MGGAVAKVWFEQFVRMVGFAQGKLFVQIARSYSSKRRVPCRASTTSTGERPTNGFPSVAVGEQGGVDLSVLGFLMDVRRSLRKTMTSFLERGTRFLQVAGAFRGGIFGYWEACPLRKKQVARALEGRVLMVEE